MHIIPTPDDPDTPFDDGSVICDRRGRLDPGRLARAVELLVGARPELAGPSDEAGVPGRFVHLDLSTAPARERPSAEEAVRWVLRRCLERVGGMGFIVTYVDAGLDQPGRLVLAGSRASVSGDLDCAALVEALLELYGALASDPEASAR